MRPGRERKKGIASLVSGALSRLPDDCDLRSSMRIYTKASLFKRIHQYLREHVLWCLTLITRKKPVVSRNLPERIEIPSRSDPKSPHVLVKTNMDGKCRRTTTVYALRRRDCKIVLKVRLVDVVRPIDFVERVGVLNRIVASNQSAFSRQTAYCLDCGACLQEDLDSGVVDIKSVPDHVKRYLRRKKVILVLMKYKGESLERFHKDVIMNKTILKDDRVKMLKVLLMRCCNILVGFEQNQAFVADMLLRNVGVTGSLTLQVFDEEMVKVETDPSRRGRMLLDDYDQLVEALVHPSGLILEVDPFSKQCRDWLRERIGIGSYEGDDDTDLPSPYSSQSFTGSQMNEVVRRPAEHLSEDIFEDKALLTPKLEQVVVLDDDADDLGLDLDLDLDVAVKEESGPQSTPVVGDDEEFDDDDEDDVPEAEEEQEVFVPIPPIVVPCILPKKKTKKKQKKKKGKRGSRSRPSAEAEGYRRKELIRQRRRRRGFGGRSQDEFRYVEVSSSSEAEAEAEQSESDVHVPDVLVRKGSKKRRRPRSRSQGDGEKSPTPDKRKWKRRRMKEEGE